MTSQLTCGETNEEDDTAYDHSEVLEVEILPRMASELLPGDLLNLGETVGWSATSENLRTVFERQEIEDCSKATRHIS